MLFNNKPESKKEREVPVNRPSPAPVLSARKASEMPVQTVIDAWLTISGNLQSEGDVQIDGKICGDIHCTHLIIGRDSTITGDIVADEAVVRGRVKGTIRANRVVLQDTARVEGDIFHKTLAIDEGASFEGQSRRREPMQDEDATATQAVKLLQAKVAEGKRMSGGVNDCGLEARHV